MIMYFCSGSELAINHMANANTFSYTAYFNCIKVLSNKVLDRIVKQINNEDGEWELCVIRQNKSHKKKRRLRR